MLKKLIKQIEKTWKKHEIHFLLLKITWIVIFVLNLLCRYTFLSQTLLFQSTKESRSQVCSIQTIFIFCRNYPSWLFVESANYSSSDEVDLDPDQDAEIVVVECSPVLPPHIQAGLNICHSKNWKMKFQNLSRFCL